MPPTAIFRRISYLPRLSPSMKSADPMPSTDIRITSKLGAGREADVPATSRVITEAGTERDRSLGRECAERRDDADQRHADRRPDIVDGHGRPLIRDHTRIREQRGRQQLVDPELRVERAEHADV